MSFECLDVESVVIRALDNLPGFSEPPIVGLEDKPLGGRFEVVSINQPLALSSIGYFVSCSLVYQLDSADFSSRPNGDCWFTAIRDFNPCHHCIKRFVQLQSETVGY